MTPRIIPAYCNAIVRSEQVNGEIRMVTIGYHLSSEEFTPNVVVRNAAMAEQNCFEFAMNSDR